MTLSYQATLDDVAEPVIRHYLRSKTARQSRTRSTIFGAVLFAAAFVIIFRGQSIEFLLWSALTGVILGAAINFWTYIPVAKSRLRKHIETEKGHMMPTETIFTVRPGSLDCRCLGVTITFSLRDLEAISEDFSWIELSFGDKGLCTIPLRVLQDGTQKAEFIQALTANQSVEAAADPLGS